MKKWIWIPAFLVLTFIGDRALALLLRSITSSSNFRYAELYAHRAESDVVFIGNSRGLNFYQPTLDETTELTSVNLSYNGMPSELLTSLLRDYLELYGPPPHLVVDVTYLEAENDGVLVRDFRCFAQFSPRLDSLLAETDPHIHGGTHVAHLTRYGGEVAQRTFYYTSKDDRNWMVDRQISPGSVDAVQDLPKYRINYNLNRIRELAAVTKLYQDAGSEVHLTINPYYPPFRKTIGNIDSLSLDVLKLTGIPVSDYSNSITGEENFGDYQHLNKNGAEIYTARLLKDLGL